MNIASQLSAFWQDVYAADVVKAYPDFAYIMKNTKFSGKEATQGGDFVQPIIMTREHGWTYAGPNTGPVTGIGPKAASQVQARLLGYQLFGQGALDYEAASRASKGKSAFVEATELLHENLVESGSFRQELIFLYGQEGLGQVEVATTAATTFKVKASTWSPATWGGLIGAAITFTPAAGGSIVAGTAAGVTVTNVDLDPSSGTYRTVTLSGAVTLPIDARAYFLSAVDSTTGAVKEAMGLGSILTASTSLYGISLATNPYFKSTSYAVGGALTATKILSASLQAVNRGLREDVDLLVSPAAFQGFINPLVDPAASTGARKIDASYSGARMEIGTDSVTLHGQGFKIRVVTHMLVREGDAFLVPMKRLKRVGSQEMDFKTPGRGDEIFVHSPTTFSYEIRCYSNQALFLETPAKAVRLTGIS